jgi:hypothetical protein
MTYTKNSSKNSLNAHSYCNNSQNTQPPKRNIFWFSTQKATNKIYHHRETRCGVPAIVLGHFWFKYRLFIDKLSEIILDVISLAQSQKSEGKLFSMYILLSVILLGSFILYCLGASLRKRKYTF